MTTPEAAVPVPTDAPWQARGGLPLELTPRSGRPADTALERLLAGLETHAEWIHDRLEQHGALRFRGFETEKPADFEAVARAVAPDLGKDYMGTSPRDAVSEYVFNASELPDYYPIPQHCEMSFCAEPPKQLFFFCLEAPAAGSGETPLCDFRTVWRALDSAVRERFERGGVRIVRNYASPESDAEADPTQLKSWPEIFGTTDRAAVEARARAEGFEPEWRDGDALKLVSTQPVSRRHPRTGETAWYNHVTTFHRTTALAEYRRIAAFRPSERHAGLVKVATALQARLDAQPAEAQAMHSTTLDGHEFPEADVEHVRDVVWRHLVVQPWHRGDVLAIDNRSVSHGRLPYEGPRRIAVCWA